MCIRDSCCCCCCCCCYCFLSVLHRPPSPCGAAARTLELIHGTAGNVLAHSGAHFVLIHGTVEILSPTGVPQPHTIHLTVENVLARSGGTFCIYSWHRRKCSRPQGCRKQILSTAPSKMLSPMAWGANNNYPRHRRKYSRPWRGAQTITIYGIVGNTLAYIGCCKQ